MIHIMNATITKAPTPTKNEARQRDPAMQSARKGDPWHVGMKAPIGTDTHMCTEWWVQRPMCMTG